MYKCGNVVVTSPNILGSVLVSKFKKAGERLVWQTTADDHTGKFGVFPMGGRT